MEAERVAVHVVGQPGASSFPSRPGRKSTPKPEVTQFVKPLSTLKSLHTLRLCGISSDSSTLPHPPLHSLKLTEVVLMEVK